MKKLAALMFVVFSVMLAAPAFSATSPFADVPEKHWAYDAIGLLASKGIVSATSSPDGLWHGERLATRYEIAAIVARALATVDVAKADKSELELLKKLTLEFGDELTALGVRVDKLDKRVAVLEEKFGGWHITGTFSFDAKFSSSDSGAYYFTENGARNEFTKNMFYLYLTKQIDEKTYLYAQYRTGSNSTGGDGRGDQQHMLWSHIFVNTSLPNDIDLRVGRFGVDFEAENGLYGDNDALFSDYRTDGFMLTKRWSTFKATAVVGRNDGYFMEAMLGLDTGSTMNYVLDLNWRPNEKLFVGATGYWFDADTPTINGTHVDGDFDANVYGVYAGYQFVPGAILKGVFYYQDLGYNVPAYYSGMVAGNTNDTPQAWKAIIDIKQDLLKFTGLWIEHSQQDNTFLAYNNRYSYGGGAGNYDYVGRNMEYADPCATSKWWFVKAYQTWNDKWSSYIRFANVDYDTAWLDDVTEWGVAIAYQYTPAIRFELAYDWIDHGDNNISGAAWGAESVVRFRTDVNF